MAEPDFVTYYGPVGLVFTVLTGWLGFLHRHVFGLKEKLVAKDDFRALMDQHRDDFKEAMTKQHDTFLLHSNQVKDAINQRFETVDRVLDRVDRRLDNVPRERE